ncbi:MoxR-like ATPase [Planifilum fimeticola]|uniref:MoxR-like ATPase n=1 Tax=Planifilum fimeticola TaxID=201975 RepID=A0A2T0LA76_9BACL|nr:AAA family ATPase [Planifilum fimeticola]PRX38639.1 MoxR-like ATPase [Planifilum fimeticola]
MFQKIIEIKNALNTRFFEREREVEALLIALLARQHLLLIGPAGTAKSALSAELAKIVQGANYFQWLLTRFSTPEELFGPLSLKELEKGVYKRNTAGKMPEAHIVFLDEIFKSNSAILNSLLTLINERVFYNNGTPVQTPLMTIVGASNEYPEEGEGLEALFDRFLLRCEVDYIVDDQCFISMLKGTRANQAMPSITLDELRQFQFYADMVDIPDEVYQTLATIRRKLRDEGIRPSDRRFRQSLRLLQAKALIEQRQTVELKDILILSHALWETVDQKEIVSGIVKENAQDRITTELERIEAESTDILAAVRENGSTDAGLEATQKLKALEAQLKRLSAEHSDRKAEILPLLKKVMERKRFVTETILGV